MSNINMRLEPLSDRVLLKRVENTETTPGGIFIPAAAQEKQTEGIVIAAGPGKVHEDGKFHEVSVKKGDRVLFGKYAGHEITISGSDYVVVREDDIIGKIVDESNRNS